MSYLLYRFVPIPVKEAKLPLREGETSSEWSANWRRGERSSYLLPDRQRDDRRNTVCSATFSSPNFNYYLARLYDAHGA